MFPWVIGGMVMLCGILHAMQGLVRGVTATIEPEGEGGTPGDPKRRLAVLAWIAALLISLPVVGFDIALPAFIIAFMIAEGERWWLAVLVAALFWAFMTYVLGGLVHVNLPPSWLDRQFW